MELLKWVKLQYFIELLLNIVKSSNNKLWDRQVEEGRGVYSNRFIKAPLRKA